MTAPFQYRAQLSGREIRLLKLEPQGKDEQIRCSLDHKPLDSAPKYNALSYCWGDATCTRQIICNGAVCGVTESLYEALVHIRKTHFATPLWADAICLNQEDDSEKTQQVRMMQDIYRQADLVIIWLGREEPGDRQGYELARGLKTVIGSPLSSDLNSDEVLEKYARIDNFELESELQPLMAMKDGWLGLGKLLLRPWFSRIWIIQEIMMARSTYMISGDFEMDAEVLLNAGCLLKQVYRFLTFINLQVEGSLPGLMASLSCVNALGLLKGTPEVWSKEGPDALMLTMSFKATDPRDRIFALAGLIRVIPQYLIDYHRDRAAVSKDLAKLLMEVTHPIEALSWTRTTGSISGGPSWAPDWTNTREEPPNAIAQLMPSEKLGDSGPYSFRIENDELLVVRGKMLDTVQTIVRTPKLPTMNGATNFSDPAVKANTATQLCIWIQEVLQLCPQQLYVTGIPTREAIWRTIILNGSLFHYPAPHEYGDLFDAWRHVLEEVPDCINALGSYSTQDQVPVALLKRAANIEESIQRTIAIDSTLSKAAFSHDFAITAKGYFGWVPKEAQVGDSVVSFNGGYVPFILRAASVKEAAASDMTHGSESPRIGTDRWLLIGDSYFHGLVGDLPSKMEDISTCDISMV